jgi:hypothetical protein
MPNIRYSLAAAAMLAAGLAFSGGALAANDADPSLTAEDQIPSPPAPNDVYTAFVQNDGDLKRGINVKSTKKLGKGEYQVIFKNDVDKCVWVASIGLPGTGNPKPGIISTALRSGNNKGIYVITGDQGARVENLPFALIVTCP